MEWRCHVCDHVHGELPDIGADYPDHFWGIPDAERPDRVRWTTETCEIDGDAFFIRGVVQVPVMGQEEPFGFGVWVSLKDENFRLYEEQPDTEDIGPFFGWLCTRVAVYPEDTTSLKTTVAFGGNNQRPLIWIDDSETHQLAVDQREGITLERAWEIVHFYMDQAPAE